MKIIDRYIMRSVVNSTLFLTFVFVALLFFINLINERFDMSKGAYHLPQALIFVIYTLPTALYSLFPNVALLGALIGLGALASYSELTVIRVSGMSILRISASVVFAALIMIIIATIIGEAIAPRLAAIAETDKSTAINNGQMLVTENGIWLHRVDTFIRIGSSFNGSHLTDITRYQFNAANQLVGESHADSADYLQGNQWRVKNITESVISPQQVTTNNNNEAIWQMDLAPPSLGILQTEEMGLYELKQQIHYRSINGLNDNQYLLYFWQRLLQPLTTLIMVILAIPFVFGPLRSSTVGFRLLCGLLIGLSLFVFNRFFGPFSLVYQIPPFLSAAIPAVIFFCVSVFMLWKKQ